ncbi:DUF2207 domain-containing protein [Candidatus Uhrbacteria bacterium]|nr:DUF2207 domain-containing protein [Candidatus Uhrbacteria bacterium]
MKKALLIIGIFMGSFLGGLDLFAAEVIQNFDVRADLSANRLLRVTEVITYDFGDAERHGIFRVIPVKYVRDKGTYHLRLTVVGVTMDGKPVPYDVTTEGAGKQIKIGDPNATITGPHTYAITYETRRALNDFADHTELYWNTTGNDWNVPIQQATFSLNAPGAIARVTCYVGYVGSKDQSCSAESVEHVATFQTTRSLNPGEGLTMVAAFPAGVIGPKPWTEYAWDLFTKSIWYLLPVLVLLFMFVKWWRQGRDPKGRGTIIAQYEEPHGMAPAMMAALISERVPERAITATILDLARQGYLKVKFFGDHKDPHQASNKQVPIIFTKLKPADDRLLRFEKTMYDGLFSRGDETNTEMLSGKFWKTVADMRNGVHEELKQRGWVTANPSSIRAAWITLGVSLVIIGGFLGMSGSPTSMISLFACAVMVILFGWFMPRVTKAGAEAREECLGFREFLSVTEKDRLHFHDAPEKRPEQFGRFLPAAMALGVEEKWAKQFEGMEMQMPDYMQGGSGITTPLAFAHMVESMSDAAASTVYSTPSSTSGGKGYSGFSGGGGSSGGGFGGGGGGSW